MVIVLGQDGLVANTMKYLNGQPIVAINPLPDLFDGILLPFLPEQTGQVILEILNQSYSTKEVSLAEVNTNLGQSLLAVNDLFIGPKSHTSARYNLAIGNSSEEQSSSGIIVSTGLGSTGWFKSVLAGASGIAGTSVRQKLQNGFAWDSSFLYYSVREPFPSSVTSCNNVFGKVSKIKSLLLLQEWLKMVSFFQTGLNQTA